MSSPKPKAWLKTGDVIKALRATQSELSRATPHLPHAYVSKRGMHLYPTPYVVALGTFLRMHELALGTISARRFWHTPIAQRLAKEAEQRLNQALAAQPDFTAKQIVALLGITRQTVTDWFDAGILKGGYRLRPQTPGGIPRLMLVVTATSLKQALQWKAPIIQPGRQP